MSFCCNGLPTEKNNHNMAAEQTKEDPIARLNNILQIIQGNKFVQGHGSQNYICLSDENGMINERTRVFLMKEVQNVIGQLTALKQTKTKTKWLSGFFSSSSSSQKEWNVQLYIPEHLLSPSTIQFGDILTKVMYDQSIQCQLVQNGSIREDVPLLLVCPFNSRLDASIEHAIDGFEFKACFMVIIIHQGTKESLPVTSSRPKFKVKPGLENIEIIDLAYNKEDMIYACDMNKKALAQIKTFVEKKM